MEKKWKIKMEKKQKTKQQKDQNENQIERRTIHLFLPKNNS